MVDDEKTDYSSTDWGARTQKNKIRELQAAMRRQREFDEKAQPHLDTVAEIKIFVKWVKMIVAAIIGFAGLFIALQQLGLMG